MALSKGDQAALKAAQDIKARGQALGNADLVAEGDRVINNITGGMTTPATSGSLESGMMASSVRTTTPSYAAAANGGLPDGVVLRNTGSGNVSYAGAAKSGSTQGDELASALKSLYSSNGLYASALAAQQKANQANVDKAVSTLEGQKQNTSQSYADMFKQLYVQKMNAKKNIGQQMAAQGVTGGASESTLLGLETNYSDALRQGEQGRINALGELDRAITAARLDGDIANAQLAADSAREQTAGYASVLQGLMNRYDNQQAQQTAYEREDAANKLSYARQLAISIAQGGNMPTDDLLTAAGMTRADAEAIVASVAQSRQDEQDALTYSQALQKAETLAAYGDFSGYAALGYTAAEIAAMKTAYDKAVAAEKAANAPKYTPKTYTATQAEQALKVAMQGDTGDAVRAIIEGYYGLPLESVLKANGYTPLRATENRTNLDYDEDEGVFAWGGRTYTDINQLLNAVSAAGLSAAELEALKKQFAVYGFKLE